ncbi:3-methyl-2-oxobutanoate dehydrogenase subunit VorB, partial [candidate division KSB1 bacterium]|nr:3-methyl-2-oxobutanoate dehydrogenase subunit VorB [candidate division KSB1 bacterium]
LEQEYCKGCGRCVIACPRDALHISTKINPISGIFPAEIDYEICNGCGLCVAACPEPYGLRAGHFEGEFQLEDPEKLFGEKQTTAPKPINIPSELLDLPESEPFIIKGTYAAAIGALLGGCRHFFGYPITPSTEGTELMAKVLPKLGGVFVQAVSEVATVNMMYGCGGAGLPCMTFTSSPGFSLMLEGVSYMISAQVPGVFINIMRGGPGLGNIGPEQADLKLVCRGLGHGNTHAIALAPSTPQEMLDLTMFAFQLAFKYRNPVVVMGDGYLGQMTGSVQLPKKMVKTGLPEWAVYGDESHRKNLIASIKLSEPDLEQHNIMLNKKYETMNTNEQRSASFQCEDADVLIVSCNTPAQMAKGAVQVLRSRGIKAGLFRPITVWPFPIKALLPLVKKAQKIVVVEASNGQLEDEMRLALSKAGVYRLPLIESIRHFGGVLPQMNEIIEKIGASEEVMS